MHEVCLRVGVAVNPNNTEAAAFILGVLIGALIGLVLTVTVGAVVAGVIMKWKRDRK